MSHFKRTGVAFGKVVFVALGVPYGIVILVNCVHKWPQSDPSQGRISKQLKPSRVLKVNYAICEQLGMIKWLPLLLRGKAFYSNAESVLKGKMHHMVTDIIDAISEFQKLSVTLSISADIQRVVLVGHSAGAHLATMAVVNAASRPVNRSAQLSVATTDDTVFQSDSAENHFEDDPRTDESGKKNGGRLRSESFQCKVTGVESCVENSMQVNQPVRNSESDVEIDLAACVKGVIGIGGVYHIMDHYHHEAKRGVEDLSPMWRAAEGLENFDRYSPTTLVPSLNDDQKKRLPPHMLIHGLEDKTVPLSSSSKFAEILSEAGVPTVLKLIPEGGHAELVMDMMESDRRWYSVMMSMVMEGVASFFQDEES